MKKKRELTQDEMFKLYKDGPKNRAFRDVFWRYYETIEQSKLQILNMTNLEAKYEKDLKEKSEDNSETDFALKDLRMRIKNVYVNLVSLEEEMLKFLDPGGQTVTEVLEQIDKWAKETHEKYEKSEGTNL